MTRVSKNVCFVCYGNLCRSPMASIIMRDIVERAPQLRQREIEICSAGTGAIGGHPAHHNAQETMREWGLSLDNHITRRLSGHIVDRADVIVTLDSYVKEDVIRSFPNSLDKICFLNIEDPYGHSIVAYRRCAQQIRDNCISKVLPLVKSLFEPE